MKIQKKFFFLGGGGEVWSGSGLGGRAGGVRLDVIEE